MTSIRYPPSRQNHRKESWRRIMTNYIIIQIEIIKNSISTNRQNRQNRPKSPKISKKSKKILKSKKPSKNFKNSKNLRLQKVQKFQKGPKKDYIICEQPLIECHCSSH